MNTTLPKPNIQRDLPAVFELLRAASGLVAVVTLTGMVVATTLFAEHVDEPRVPTATSHQTKPPEAPAGPTTVVWNATPHHPVVVFYLVATAAQADLADWGEQVGAHEALSAGVGLDNRKYHVHYARDEAEERETGQAMLDRVLQYRDSAIVEVIDLRSLNVE